MTRNSKIWWAVSFALGVSALLGLTLEILLWHQSVQQNNLLLQDLFSRFGHYFLLASLMLIAGLGFLLARIFQIVIIPMNELSEEVDLIFSVNPTHRVSLEGSHGLERLVEKINLGAEKYETSEQRISDRVHAAKAELDEEKNILAAIMAELPDAVLICNKEGKIVLYNSQAKRFFGENPTVRHPNHSPSPQNHAEVNQPGFLHLGIGRSIFDLIGKNIIQHALEDIIQKLDREEENVSSNFVVTDRTNKLLKAEATPILNPLQKLSGFIVIFNDITQDLRNEARSKFLHGTFHQKIRHSVAGIKSAVEFIRDYPDTKSAQQHRLIQIIHAESQELEQLIQQRTKETYRQSSNQWPLMPISIHELVETLQKKAAERLSISLVVEPFKEKCWVKVDTYAMILILLFLLERIGSEVGARQFMFRFSEDEEFAFFDFIWEGAPVKIDKIRQWETMELSFMKEGMPLHLKEILDHHNAEMWSFVAHQQEMRSCLRIYLPLLRPQVDDKIRRAAILPGSRPEFYEFDMFNQPGQSPDLDHRPLKELVCTVFDTETTGLDPSAGDDIISIGALRIVNSHILTEETFNQLINPQRSIPQSTIQIHGITDDMVKSQPGIQEVLPAFYTFAQDTVLVAHNAAFDMRMLQRYESQTAIKFINPVLDTLLLSAIVHSAHDDQTLSAIASRLAVSLAGRHTAMGDALMTAKIFIKLIPLLETKGIRTFGDAREASQKTYYARLNF